MGPDSTTPRSRRSSRLRSEPSDQPSPLSAREVVPGVHAVPVQVFGVPYVNTFLIEDGPGLALVDSGLPKRAELLLAAVAALGRTPKDLRHILITHHHEDHTGSLAALGRRTGATVYAHALDIPVVQGDRPGPPASRPNAFSRLTERIGRRMGFTEVEPAMVGHPVADGEVLPIAGGLRVLHTPGHTPGHVSLLLESRRLLFAGDAAGAMFGRVGPPLGVYTEDMAEARRSLRALAEVDFDAACFGHGGFIRADAVAAFRRAVERLDQ